MHLKKVLTGSIAISLASSLYAYEMKPVGFKATGMGGTGVASTRGSLAGYYNPALLRLSDYTTEISLNVGARFREANMADNMDTLSNIDFQATLDRVAANATLGVGNNTTTDINNLKTAKTTLQSIGSRNALQAGVNASLSAQMSDALAIGVYADVDVGLQLKIDSNRLDLIFQKSGSYFKYDPDTDTYSVSDQSSYESSSLEYAVDNGLSYVQLDATVLAEVPISYAKAYDFSSGFWSFGLSAKAMSLTAYDKKVDLGKKSGDANDESDSSANEITYKNTFGLDLGLAYQPKGTDLTIGLVGKNINSPKFKVDRVGTSVSSASDYELDPYFRAGISYPIWNNNIEFALDADLQKSDTIIPGEKTQMVGAGIELHPASWFAFRVGAMTDVASETYDDGVIATAGIGFGLKWFQFDLSAMMSNESGTYDGNEIPRYAAVNLSLLSRWGDGYNKKRPPVYKSSEEDLIENETPTKILTDEKVKEMEKELDEETNPVKKNLELQKLLEN